MKRMFILLSVAILAGCHSVPATIDTSKTDSIAVDVMTTQTEIATSGKDVQSTIEAVKVITDDAKLTGEIPKDKIQVVIKYIDTASSQIADHNKLIESLAPLTSEFMKSRIADNKSHAEIISTFSATIDKLKAQVSRRGTAILFLSITLALFIIFGILIVWLRLKNCFELKTR